MKGKVFVGLSGGVDSSVSASLLKRLGFDVVGVFIKVWQPEEDKFKKICTWREDRRDAMRIAAHLKIPFKTLDLSNEYKKEVVDYMISEYKSGRTPNPDILCNKSIKFGSFYDWAIKNGADYVATGHYARIDKKNDEYYFKKGLDQNKDQSYFLWTLKKKQLPHILFPLGNYNKSKVRQLADKFNLVTADKKDSQGVCFIGKLDIKEFLKTYIKEKPGKVINEKGLEIGSHDGVFFYTLGERRGFNIKAQENNQKPYFVIGKDVDKNELIVSNEKEINKHTQKEIKIKNINWINSEPKENKVYTCQYRYRGELIKCQIKDNLIILEKGKSDIPSGQSLVLYDGDICLGGGIII